MINIFVCLVDIVVVPEDSFSFVITLFYLFDNVGNLDMNVELDVYLLMNSNFGFNLKAG